MRSVIVADFTRTYDHLLDSICRALVSRASNQSPAADLIAVVKPEQEPLVKAAGIVRTQIDGNSDASLTVGTLLTALSDGQVTVASHNPSVLSMATSRGSQALHLSELAPSRMPFVQSSSTMGQSPRVPMLRSAGPQRGSLWPFDHISSHDHALEVMLMALRSMRAEGRSRAVQHVDIRPEMARIDPSFRGKAIQTNSTGMMSVLLDDAARRGLIGQEVFSAKERRVWLVDEAQREASSPEVRVAQGPADGADQQVVPQAQTQPEGYSQRSRVHDNLPSPPVVTESRTPHRSEVWGDMVRRRKMGAFADARPRIYPHLEKQRGVPLAPAIAKAISAARTELTTRQPWPDIQEFFERLLIGLELVVWEERPKTSKDAAFTRIKEFKAEWTVAVDAEIVWTVLTEVQWIEGSLQDRRDLARVLYRNSTEEWQAQAWAALRFLVKAGRILEDETGFSLPTTARTAGAPAQRQDQSDTEKALDTEDTQRH
jgi:hypothetical protein